MYALDTDEKFEWFLNAIENEEIIIDGRGMTEDDHKQLAGEIAEYKETRKKEKAEKELVFA